MRSVAHSLNSVKQYSTSELTRSTHYIRKVLLLCTANFVVNSVQKDPDFIMMMPYLLFPLRQIDRERERERERCKPDSTPNKKGALLWDV